MSTAAISASSSDGHTGPVCRVRNARSSAPAIATVTCGSSPRAQNLVSMPWRRSCAATGASKGGPGKCAQRNVGRPRAARYAAVIAAPPPACRVSPSANTSVPIVGRRGRPVKTRSQ